MINLGRKTTVPMGYLDTQSLKSEFDIKINALAYQLTPNMTTLELQTALDNYNNFFWNTGTYNLNPIFFRSNAYHKFAPNVILQANAGYLSNDCLVSIKGQENITIDCSHTKLKMNYSEYTSGEWRHCLSMRGSKNIIFNNTLILEDSGGDGIYIGSDGDGIYSENIKFNTIISKHHRRQGMSVVSVKRLYIDNIYIENIIGTAPQFGIDLEPNNPLDKLSDVYIKNIETKNCKGGGIAICLDKLAHNTSYVDNLTNSVSISIENYKSTDDEVGISFYPHNYKVGGTINFENVVIEGSKKNGIVSAEWFEDKTPFVKFNNTSIRNTNTENNTSETLGSAIVSFCAAGKSAGKIGNISFKDLKIIDDREVPLIKNGIYAYNSTSTNQVSVAINNLDVSGVSNKKVSVYGDIYDESRIIKPKKEITVSTVISGNTDYNKYSNKGATTAITASLSFANIGTIIEFEVEESQYLRIKPFTASDLLYPDITGGSVFWASNKKGSKIKIKKTETDKYLVVEQIGVWEKI